MICIYIYIDHCISYARGIIYVRLNGARDGNIVLYGFCQTDGIYIYIYIYLPCRLYAKRGRVCVWGFLVVSSLHIHTKPYCWEYNTLAAHECQRNDRMGLYTPKSSYPYIPISLPLPLIYPHGHTNTAFYLPTCLMCYACVHCGWIGGIWVFVLVSILNFLVFKTHTRALMNPHRTYIQLRMYSCT